MNLLFYGVRFTTTWTFFRQVFSHKSVLFPEQAIQIISPNLQPLHTLSIIFIQIINPLNTTTCMPQYGLCNFIRALQTRQTCRFAHHCHGFPLLVCRQYFRPRATCSASLSSMTSASSFLRRTLSSSSDLSLFTSGTFMPPNFSRQV